MIWLYLFVFYFGAMIGSFLNVVIYRLPKELSVVKPRSSCVKCGHVLNWYELFPILSYLVLRGKCSACGTKISLRYPLIEFFTGIVALLLFPQSLNPILLGQFFFLFAVFCIFLAHFVIDLEHQLLPDGLNIYLGLLFLLDVIFKQPPLFWISGALIGFVFTYGVTWIFYKIKGQVGLGGGDIKLFTVLGLYLGPMGIVQNIFVSCFLGTIIFFILMALKKIKRDSPIAFGPFILVTATLQIYFPSLYHDLIGRLFL